MRVVEDVFSATDRRLRAVLTRHGSRLIHTSVVVCGGTVRAMSWIEATLTLMAIATWLTLHIVAHLVLVISERLIVTEPD